ncbi:MAG: hypothetical protein BWY63_00345 [Chloroflexi bacterium ADurb.Bin360]|nr:MAG: hypothetical protein BWY63_00345 [Chloroflexi bacterium ADurb.Bin360]
MLEAANLIVVDVWRWAGVDQEVHSATRTTPMA